MARNFKATFIFGGNLDKALRRLKFEGKRAADRAAERTARFVLNDVVAKTPRRSGRAAGSWSLQKLGTAVQVFKVVSRGTKYITVLEYGGYPVRPNTPGASGGFVRGRARLGGHRPGPNTRRPGRLRIPERPGLDIEPALPFGKVLNPNVSKRAPKGMLRASLIKRDSTTLLRALERNLLTAFRRADR